MTQTCNAGHITSDEWDTLAEASKQGHLVATSTTHFVKVYREFKGAWGFTHETSRIEYRYGSEFIVDAWRESFVSNTACRGNHRTHEAAVNCGIRYANRVGIIGAQRLEDAHYV